MCYTGISDRVDDGVMKLSKTFKKFFHLIGKCFSVITKSLVTSKHFKIIVISTQTISAMYTAK